MGLAALAFRKVWNMPQINSLSIEALGSLRGHRDATANSIKRAF